MKLTTPKIKDCRYIHEKLMVFKKVKSEEEFQNKQVEFNRVLKRFCDFFHLPIPKIEWYESIIGTDFLTGKWIVGKCFQDEPKLRLIKPHFYNNLPLNMNWEEVVYHELGHYILWSDAEFKAKQFAKRMMEKWRE